MRDPISPQSAYSSVRQSEELPERPISPLTVSTQTTTTEESDPQYRQTSPDHAAGWPFHRRSQLSAVPEEPSRSRLSHHHSRTQHTNRSGASLAPDQPPKTRRNGCSSFQAYFDNNWTAELLALLLAFLCLVAIMLVLRKYDGQSISDLPDGVGLSAILAILSTAFKSALIYAVSSAIGQAKWDWFGGRQRSLQDIQRLDEASRGPLGSIRTLFAPTIGSVAAVGAIITIFAVALDPFVQQVMHYSSDGVTTSKTEAWTKKASSPSFLPNTSNPTYLGAINGPVYINATAYTQEVSCPEGDCSWSSFESLGWCVKTQVVSDPQNLRVDCNISQANADYSRSGPFGIGGASSKKNCSVYFDGNTTVPLTYPLVYSSSTTGNVEVVPLEVVAPMSSTAGGNETILGIQGPELAMSHFRFTLAEPPDDSSPPDSMNLTWAEQAVLVTCIKEYNVSVVKGAVDRQTLNERYGTFYNDSTTALGPNATCWKPDDASVPQSSAWQEQTVGGSRYITDPSTMAFCATNWTWGADIGYRLSSVYKADLHETSPNTTEYWNAADWGSTAEIFDQIKARGLESVMQSMGSSLDSLYSTYSDEFSPGTYTQHTADTHLHVRWWWLIMPLVLWVLGLLFLTIVMIRSRNSEGVWKGSLLAALYHGLENSTSEGSLSTCTAMNYAAKHTVVRLARTANGDKLVMS